MLCLYILKKSLKGVKNFTLSMNNERVNKQGLIKPVRIQSRYALDSVDILKKIKG